MTAQGDELVPHGDEKEAHRAKMTAMSDLVDVPPIPPAQ
jgi:hypothetical protein